MAVGIRGRWSPGPAVRTGPGMRRSHSALLRSAPNKRGMTYEGGDVTFDVLSNVYWVINLDEDGPTGWTVAPRAAYGNQTVKVTAGRESRGQAFERRFGSFGWTA